MNEFSVLYFKKPFERNMEKNVWEKIAKNLDFVEHSNFIRRTTESAFRGCPGVNSEENIHGGVLL